MTCLGPEVVEQHGGQVALPKAGQDDHNELALVLDALSKPADKQVSRYAQTAAASMTEFGFCIAATLSGECACCTTTPFLPSSLLKTKSSGTLLIVLTNIETTAGCQDG